MDPKISASPSAVPGAMLTTSAPRPTPTQPKVPFGEIMNRTLAVGAQVAMTTIPGAPLMAFALRGGAGPSMPVGSSVTTGAASASTTSAEGPTATSGGTGTGTGTGGGLEGSLAQSQEMNMYYLQIQEQVNAQNRSFTTLSNVLKAEHETVKTAIGNIR
jgi:hypothetical protein